MMTTSLKRVWSGLAALVLAATGFHASADVDVSFVAKPYLKGSDPAVATIEMFVNTNDAAIGLQSLRIVLNGGDGTAITKDNSSCTIVDDAHYNGNNKLSNTSQAYAGKVQYYVKQANTSYAVKPSTDPNNKVATFVVAIDEATAVDDTATLTVNLNSCQGWNVEDDVLADVTVNIPETIALRLVDKFAFDVAAGTTILSMEDETDVAKLTIRATDEPFTAQVWDEATNDFVPTTNVKFLEASCPEEAGTVSIVDGAMVYAPAANYNGSFNVTFTACLADDETAKVSGLILPWTVVPVNDAPVATITTADITVDEGDVLAFGVTVTDVDAALGETAVLAVTMGGNAIAGTWNGRTWTADEPVSYDTVFGQASQEFALSVIATDAAGATSDPATATVTVNDVIRALVGAPTVGVYPATPVTNDALTLAIDGDVTSPDGYTVTRTIMWYKNEAEAAPAKLQIPASETAKGDAWKTVVTWSCAPYDGAVAPAAITATSNTVIVGNTAPVAENARKNIRKVDGGDGKATVDISATDADNDAWTVVIKNFDAALLTATANGQAIEVQIKDLDTEIVDPSVITFVVNDGTDDSAEATLAISYRSNQPATVIATVEPETAAKDEVSGDDNVPAAYTVTLEMTDSEENEGERGIANVIWTVTDANLADAGWTVAVDATPAGEVSFTQTATITTKGYETLQGADRPASGTFTIKAVVVNKTEVESDPLSWVVTINDVDRKPELPVAVTLAKTEFTTTEDIVATVTEGATDPDGDVIVGYRFTAVNGEGTEIVGASDDATTFTLTADNTAKHQVWTIKAATVTKPYGGEAVLSDGTTASDAATIINSAPVIVFADGFDGVITTAEAEGEGESLQLDLNDYVVVTDADGDAIVWNAIFACAPEAGELVDNTDGTVTYNKAVYFNRNWGVDAPSIVLSVKDDDNATATSDAITIDVTEVNQAPSVATNKFFVMVSPDGADIVGTKEITVSRGGGQDEATQNLTAEVSFVAGGILKNVEVALNGDVATISYVIDGAAQANDMADFLLTLTDDGTTNGAADPKSSAISIVVTMAASPWYPMLALDSEALSDDDTYMVNVLDATGKSICLMPVAGKNIQPVDYLDYTNGLTPGDYTYRVYSWNVAEGMGTTVLAEVALEDVAYNLPEAGTVTADIDGNAVTLNVETPVASGYKLTIYKNGTAIQTVEDRYRETSGDSGMIVNSGVVKIEIYDEGTYTAELRGFNPLGYGEATTTEFTIGNGSVVTAFDGAFSPDGANIIVGGNTYTVDFSWPLLNLGDTYDVYVYDSNGYVAASGKNIENQTWSATLPSSADLTTYSWRVVAHTERGTVNSDTFAFTLVRKSSTPILSGIYADADGKLVIKADDSTGSFDGVTYQVLFFSVNANNGQGQWYYSRNVRVVAAADGTLSLAGQDFTAVAGDLCFLIPVLNGKEQTKDYIPFTVKPLAEDGNIITRF